MQSLFLHGGLERKRLACRLPAERGKRTSRRKFPDDHTPFSPRQGAAWHALAASRMLAFPVSSNLFKHKEIYFTLY